MGLHWEHQGSPFFCIWSRDICRRAHGYLNVNFHRQQVAMLHKMSASFIGGRRTDYCACPSWGRCPGPPPHQLPLGTLLLVNRCLKSARIASSSPAMQITTSSDLDSLLCIHFKIHIGTDTVQGIGANDSIATDNWTGDKSPEQR